MKLLSTLVLSAALALPALAETADVKTGATVITFSDTVATAFLSPARLGKVI